MLLCTSDVPDALTRTGAHRVKRALRCDRRVAVRSQSADYVKNLAIVGLARALTARNEATSPAAAGRPEEAATIADLERLKVKIDLAAAHAAAELQRFQRLSWAGILMLCATILLLHFSRH